MAFGGRRSTDRSSSKVVEPSGALEAERTDGVVGAAADGESTEGGGWWGVVDDEVAAAVEAAAPALTARVPAVMAARMDLRCWGCLMMSL